MLRFFKLTGIDDFTGDGPLYLLGRRGDDRVTLSGGDDTIYARGGDDRIFAPKGNNLIYAGGGDDTIFSGEGENAIFGDDGIDVVSYALSGARVRVDLEAGGSQGDADGDTYDSIEVVIGTNFDDTIFGDKGDNTLTGGRGDDVINGRGGIDTYVATSEEQNGVEIALGNAALELAQNFGISFVDPAPGKGLAVTLVGNGFDFDRLIGIENVVGTERDDSFTGDDGNNIYGYNGGKDTIDGSGGINTLELLTGTQVHIDLAEGTGSFLGSDALTITDFQNVTGYVNDDILAGDGRDNVLDGSFGSDVLIGRGGDDLLLGGDGEFEDLLIGGNGNDTMHGGAAGDMHDGGSGRDIASYEGERGVTASLLKPSKNQGDAEGDTYRSVEGLLGSDADDELQGDNGDNILAGGNGDDHIVGCDGDDTIIGGAGEAGGLSIETDPDLDLCFCDPESDDDQEQTDIDILIGNCGDDLILGGAGFDLLYGNRDDDTLSGGGGIDLLFGGRGNDVLAGDASFDFLIGGPGRDTASYTASPDAISVDLIDMSEVYGGHAEANSIRDLIDIFNDASSGEAALQSISTSAIFIGLLGGEDGALSSGIPDVLVQIENVTGSDFDDRLFGNRDANLLEGLNGRDTLVGRDGDDELRGQKGNDQLSGGRGQDRLVSNKGSDTATGGADADTFVYARGDGRGNVVTDFEIGTDLIEIGAGASRFGQVTIRDRGNDAEVQFSDVRILLQDVDHDQLSASDFIFV